MKIFQSRILNLIGWIFTIIVIDLILWIIIGMILLNYEDNWDSTKGLYFSLGGMTWTERIAYVSYYLWIVLNVASILYLIYLLFKKLKTKN